MWTIGRSQRVEENIDLSSVKYGTSSNHSNTVIEFKNYMYYLYTVLTLPRFFRKSVLKRIQ